MHAAMTFAFVMVLPALLKGNASGHDFEFHLVSWMEVCNQWHEGALYPRWAAGANYGYGEPQFIFYPPLSWILGAALGNVLPWRSVPGLFAWLALTLAGLSAYRLVRELQPQGIALWAAGFYATNPYNLLNVYHRSSFAELLASALFPLAVLYALRLVPSRGNDKSEGKRPQESIVLLACVVAAIWLTNAPAGVLTCYGLALLLVVAAIRSQSVLPLLRGGLACALGLGLSGFYIVPALYEQKWVHIAAAFTSGLRLEDNFPFTWWISEEHRQFNFVISWVQMAELALAALVFPAAWRALRQESRESKFSARGKSWPATSLWQADGILLVLCLGIAAALLLFRPSLPVWRSLPFLREVQFPWRTLSVLNLAMACAAATAGVPGRLRHAWKILTLALWLGLSGYLLTLAAWEGTDMEEIAASVQSGAGYESVEEYVPTAADREQLRPGAPQIALADPESPPEHLHFKVEKWLAEEKEFSVEASEPTRLQLRLLDYPAWQVEVNGAPGEQEAHPDTGQLIVSVPTGRSHVRVFFGRTPDRTVGGLLSLIAGTLTVTVFLTTKRRKPA
jgi:hypothetical protein